MTGTRTTRAIPRLVLGTVLLVITTTACGQVGSAVLAGTGTNATNTGGASPDEAAVGAKGGPGASAGVDAHGASAGVGVGDGIGASAAAGVDGASAAIGAGGLGARAKAGSTSGQVTLTGAVNWSGTVTGTCLSAAVARHVHVTLGNGGTLSINVASSAAGNIDLVTGNGSYTDNWFGDTGVVTLDTKSLRVNNATVRQGSRTVQVTASFDC